MTSSFLKEVAEQPGALRDLIAYYRQGGKQRLIEWRRWAEKAGRITLAGMGTSEAVAEAALPLLSAQGLDATVLDAGEGLHYRRPTQGVLVLISQSGESAETRKLAEHCPSAEGFVALTNQPQSTIATRAKLALPMLAGAESAISAKTYVNSLALLYLMAQPAAELDQALDRLEAVAQSMPNTNQSEIEAAADFLADAMALQFIARGPSVAAAKQAALTFMEGAKIPTCAFTGGGFRHGAVELLATPLRSILFVPSQSRTFELMRQLACDLARHQSRVLIITDGPFEVPNTQARLLRVPQHEEDLFSLSCATAQALLIESLARRRGYVAGIFTHGHKVTDQE